MYRIHRGYSCEYSTVQHEGILCYIFMAYTSPRRPKVACHAKRNRDDCSISNLSCRGRTKMSSTKGRNLQRDEWCPRLCKLQASSAFRDYLPLPLAFVQLQLQETPRDSKVTVSIEITLHLQTCVMMIGPQRKKYTVTFGEPYLHTLRNLESNPCLA